MSPHPFIRPQTEYNPELVAETVANQTVQALNMHAELTGHAYPVSGDGLRRAQVSAGQWAHLRKYYTGGDR